MNVRIVRPTRPVTRRPADAGERNLAAWLLFLVLAPAVFVLSSHYSRDYSIYIDIVASNDTTDLVFGGYVALGRLLGFSPPVTYGLFSTTLVGLLVYYFNTRRIATVWVWIYMLSFGLLHVVTQVRAGMASVVLAILLSSGHRLLRWLTPLAVTIHASAVLFVGTGWARQRPWLIVLCIALPLAAGALLGLQSDKLVDYADDVNESQVVSIAVASYAVALFVVLCARIGVPMKTLLLVIGALTLGVYATFIDLKAISNRFVELSHAVTLLLLGFLDRPTGTKGRTAIAGWLKLLLLAATLVLFYVSNFMNSILDL